MSQNSKIHILTGHYGTGKTNIAINMALDFKNVGFKTCVVDLDIVNPYFRAFDSEKLLKEREIEIIAPTYANTNLDVPSLSPLVNTVFTDKFQKAIIDVGGDDAGAIALGRYAQKIKIEDYNMYFVVNMFRPLTKDPQSAYEYLKEIQKASNLEITHLINNSSLGEITTKDDIIASFDFIKKLSALSSLPIAYNSVLSKFKDDLDGYNNIKYIDLYTKTLW